jgi:hypothetical protein
MEQIGKGCTKFRGKRKRKRPRWEKAEKGSQSTWSTGVWSPENTALVTAPRDPTVFHIYKGCS